MIRKILFFVLVSFSVAFSWYAEDVYTCSCEEIESKWYCNEYESCKWKNNTCRTTMLSNYTTQENCERHHFYWNKYNQCEIFTNRKISCHEFQSVEECYEDFCIWNDKNQCIPKDFVEICQSPINYFVFSCDYKYCIIDNEICRYKNCFEYIDEDECHDFWVNHTHLEKCIWVNNTCVQNIDAPYTAESDEDDFVAERYFQYYDQDFGHKKCKHFIVDQEWAFQYNKWAYDLLYSKFAIQILSAIISIWILEL